jgi:hypothetical protein
LLPRFVRGQAALVAQNGTNHYYPIASILPRDFGSRRSDETSGMPCIPNPTICTIVVDVFGMKRKLTIKLLKAAARSFPLLTNPPEIGYLTISDALQWRLQYSRVIEKAGSVRGIQKLV